MKNNCSHKDSSKPQINEMQRRCPRLGSPVAFGYCRIAGDQKSTCFKVFDCWWERFDVVNYLQQRLSKEDFEKLRCAPPPNKVASLVDLIQQAKKRTGGEKT